MEERSRRRILRLIPFHVKYVIKAIIPPTSRGSTAVCHLPRGILPLLKRTGGIILYTFVLGRKTCLLVKKKKKKGVETSLNTVEIPPEGPNDFFLKNFDKQIRGIFRRILSPRPTRIDRISHVTARRESIPSRKDNLGSRERRPPCFFVDSADRLKKKRKRRSLPQRLSRVVESNKCRAFQRTIITKLDV